ncbi:unnamed protein product [Spirodela intermedia]|uniref:Uncharacterized protein n=2 Tax=Spirodela intermedia TaxID=51605 RepID=A0A7I8IAW9_SPIIN|nr:unnamed protein product [Spirodela intermedia]CAA6654876.1 unnamed protein product [Spirodela intermedia]CAA7389571.1 unnamed protein product [Spirodela intermedia]
MVEAAASYIRMVQHLIEECLVFRMTREECAEALSKHANIKPIITSTVWKELEKENREFFEAYARETDRAPTVEAMQSIQKVIHDSLSSDSDD